MLHVVPIDRYYSTVDLSTNVARLRTFEKMFNADLQVAPEGVDAASLWQHIRLRKRMDLGSTAELSSKAFDNFIAVNNSAGKVIIKLSPREIANARDFISTTLVNGMYATNSLHSAPEGWLFDPKQLAMRYRFSNGAAIGSLQNQVSKYSSAVTCTRRALPLIKLLRSYDNHLKSFDSEEVIRHSVVNGNQLGFVPKNESTMRTIATEPKDNMALQLAIGDYFALCLRVSGIDITNQQQKNKDLALAGSLSGLFSTIDLSSASDFVTPQLVEALFPPEWQHLMMCARSPKTAYGDIKGIKLNMMATMGNGFVLHYSL